MFFRTDEEARKGIFSELRNRGLMFSVVQVVSDPRMTMAINLVTYELKIGRRFLFQDIRDYDDIGFLVQHEIHHRYIANQWNKMRWIGAIRRRNPTGASYDSVPINWYAVNVAEDAFINAYIRNSGTVTSDFPEYYYTKNTKGGVPVGINKWLCNKGRFPKKTHANTLLRYIRGNSAFFIDLDLMAEIYWEILPSLDKEKQEEKDSGQKSKRPKLNILTTDDPTGSGVVVYGTESEEQIILTQAQQMQTSGLPSLSGSSKGGYYQTIYVPDLELDRDISKAFNIRTKDMSHLEKIDAGGCKVLVDYLDGTIEQSREIAAERYQAIDVPSHLSRHDMVMSVGLGQDPFYWEHPMPQRFGEDEKDIKWDIYIDVSGSMNNEIHIARWIAKRMEHLCRKMFVFSCAVWEYDGGCWINTTGGTDMNEAVRIAYEQGTKHVMFIGDGQDQYGPQYWRPEIAQWWNTIESFMVLIDDGISYRSPWLSQAQDVFRYVYDFNKDVIHEPKPHRY